MRLRAKDHLHLNNWVRLGFILWVLTMITLPLLKWTVGEAGLLWGISLGVLIQFSLVLAILHQTWSWPRIMATSMTVALLTWVAEAIGTATALPFGAYSYTDKLQPQFLHVPLLVPLAWMMLLPSAWAVAYCVCGRWNSVTFIGLSGLAFVAWDLFLDPQMVAWELWYWLEPGGYFGIPWLNFGGWFLVASLITALTRPRNLPLRPLLYIYAITWILETGGLLLFWGLPGPALVGFGGMGGFLYLAWTSRVSEANPEAGQPAS